MPTRRKCPSCSQDDAIPIVYGLPADELAQAAGRGEVALGGCLVGGEEPNWHSRRMPGGWRGTELALPELRT
jgi:hypothetical protein